MSGYCGCSCRDCFEISFTADGGWSLCRECLEAECTPFRDGLEPASAFECQREDAYSG